MNRKDPLLAYVLATALAGVSLSPGLADATPSSLHANISMSHARAMALKAYPGKIVKQELEREKGGSGLRYSFDMRNGGEWREVGIDAMTGRVLENAHEAANPKD